MTHGHDDDDDNLSSGDDNTVHALNVELLQMIGDTVKLSIVIAELSDAQKAGIRKRWTAFVSAVNAVEIEDLPQKTRPC